MKLMEGKVALLTGAAGGIGAASAIKFAKEGAKAIYIVDMAEEKAEATLAEVRKYCPLLCVPFFRTVCLFQYFLLLFFIPI